MTGQAIGCAATGRPSADAFADASGPATLSIQVVNGHDSDATVYLLRGASKRRVGSVAGGRQEVFTTPWPGEAAAAFELDLQRGERCVTNSTVLYPRESVRVSILFSERVGRDGVTRLCSLDVVRRERGAELPVQGRGR